MDDHPFPSEPDGDESDPDAPGEAGGPPHPVGLGGVERRGRGTVAGDRPHLDGRPLPPDDGDDVDLPPAGLDVPGDDPDAPAAEEVDGEILPEPSDRRPV